MQQHLESPNGRTYQAITVGDSSWLHAGDVHYHRDPPTVPPTYKCHQVFKTSTYEDFKDRNIARAEGTCQWVLTHPYFCSWKDGTSQNLLWISADPGCGKSVLAKALIDRDLNNDGQSNICYHFFKENDIQDNLVTALCAILHQLFTLQPELIRHALPIWQRNGDKLQKETGDMWRILQRCALDPEARPIFCIIDALDECRDDDRRRLISMLCELLSPVPAIDSESKIKFLVTSRPYNNVQRWFEEAVARWPHIRLRGEDENEQIRQEINLVIEGHLQTLASEFLLSSKHQDRLRLQLLNMQHRTYLWLHLAMEEILETYRSSLYPDQVEIQSLPASVDQAYERMLQKITAQQRPNARKILLIIAGAKRPLTVRELALALAAAKPHHQDHKPLDIPRTSYLQVQIRNWCGLFVYIQHSKLFLIHQTAKEFLLWDRSQPRTATDIWRACLSPVEVDREMAKLCVKYLCVTANNAQERMNSQRAAEVAVQETPKMDLSTLNTEGDFHEYCLEYWVSHYKDDMALYDAELANRVLRLYDTESKLFNAWFTRFWDNMRPKHPWWNLLSQHAIAFTGHKNILDLLHQHSPLDVDAPDGTENTALWYAANQGHDHIVKLLLDLGASVELKRPLYGSTLRTALENNHTKVVQLLLDGGVNYGSALQIAASRGQEDVVQDLLEKGANINARNQSGATALDLALMSGHGKVVKILCDRGADVVAGYDVLHLGLSRDTMMETLLDSEANPNVALMLASRQGNLKVAEQMLDEGADINHVTFSGRTAIHEALSHDHEDIVELLIDEGADIDQRDINNQTVLLRAVHRSHQRVVRLLLDMGADVNTRDAKDYTLLHMAAGQGYDKLVQILLDAGADYRLKTKHDETALDLAWVHCHQKVIKLLVDNGAPRGKDLDNWENDFAKWLINEYAESEDFEELSDIALHVCSRLGVIAGLEVVLEVVSNINIPGRYGNTALIEASSRGHSQVIEILLQGGAEINIQNNYGETALLLASDDRQESAVRILLREGAKVHLRNKSGDNALHLAARNGDKRIVEMLLDKGANVNSRTRYGETAMFLAARKGSVETVRLLINRGADVHVQNNYGDTARDTMVIWGSNRPNTLGIMLIDGAILTQMMAEMEQRPNDSEGKPLILRGSKSSESFWKSDLVESKQRVERGGSFECI